MPSLVRILVGILIIILAGLYPLWAVFRLNRRLSRPGGPGVYQLVWWLVFTLSFPFALALFGAYLVAPALGQVPVFWPSLGMFAGVALLGGLGYGVSQYLRSGRSGK